MNTEAIAGIAAQETVGHFILISVEGRLSNASGNIKEGRNLPLSGQHGFPTRSGYGKRPAAMRRGASGRSPNRRSGRDTDRPGARAIDRNLAQAAGAVEARADLR